jgi:hypothetical protein
MNHIHKSLSLLAVLVLICSPALAAKPDKKKDRGASPTARLEKKLAASELSTESRDKVKKAIEQNAAKLKEAQAKIDAVLTADQKHALRTAQKEARTAGKKGKQAREEALASLKLTAEQKSKLSAAQNEFKAAQTALNKYLRSVLSKDELAKLGIKDRKKKA